MTHKKWICDPVIVTMLVFILLCLLCLPGCGVFTTKIEIPKEVKVIVAVPCIKKSDLPSRPELRSDDDLFAMDRYKRTLAIWDERRAMQDYEAQQAAILISCTSKEN